MIRTAARQEMEGLNHTKLSLLSCKEPSPDVLIGQHNQQANKTRSDCSNCQSHGNRAFSPQKQGFCRCENLKPLARRGLGSFILRRDKENMATAHLHLVCSVDLSVKLMPDFCSGRIKILIRNTGLRKINN